MVDVYTRTVSFCFHCFHNDWAVTEYIPQRGTNPAYMWVEDLRKNGQEDYHMAGGFWLSDEGWSYECSEDPEDRRYDNMVQQIGEEGISALESFFDTNGPPPMEDGFS